MWGLRFGVVGVGFRIEWYLFGAAAARPQPGLGFRVQGSGFRVQGSGFRVYGVGLRV